MQNSNRGGQGNPLGCSSDETFNVIGQTGRNFHKNHRLSTDAAMYADMEVNLNPRFGHGVNLGRSRV